LARALIKIDPVAVDNNARNIRQPGLQGTQMKVVAKLMRQAIDRYKKNNNTKPCGLTRASVSGC